MENMDEIRKLLSPILEDPEALGSILSKAEQMGFSIPDNPPPGPRRDSGPDILSSISKLTPMLSEISKEDDTTRLLNALHPFLKGERGKKLENAQRILSMMRVMNMLKDNSLI